MSSSRNFKELLRLSEREWVSFNDIPSKQQKNKLMVNNLNSKSVIDSGDFYIIPDEQKLSEIKSGFYYPCYRSQQASMGKLNLEDDGEEYFFMDKYHDQIKHADDIINTFCSGEEFYENNSISYRRALLFFGDPGTGKSKYLIEKCNQLVKSHDSIIFRIENEYHLEVFINNIVLYNKVSKGRFRIIFIEELGDLCSNVSQVNELLQLLDSPVLRDRVLFLMTTNFPENIPGNIVDRPSRIDTFIEVNSSNYSENFTEAWYKHLLMEDMPQVDSEIKKEIAKLSAAYQKELFLSTKLYNCSVEESYDMIKKRKSLIKRRFKSDSSSKFGFYNND